MNLVCDQATSHLLIAPPYCILVRGRYCFWHASYSSHLVLSRPWLPIRSRSNLEQELELDVLRLERLLDRERCEADDCLFPFFRIASRERCDDFYWLDEIPGNMPGTEKKGSEERRKTVIAGDSGGKSGWCASSTAPRAEACRPICGRWHSKRFAMIQRF